MDKDRIIRGIESLVNPEEVATLSFMQMFNRLLPKRMQNYLVEKSSKKYPYMGFIVDPYSYFVCYEIKDIELAKSLLPDGFRLVKTKVFEDSESKYCCIFGCIQAKTSAFIGVRVEFYIIAEDEKTGMMSWIIVDYDTNTISHDKQNGLRNPNTKIATITTDFEGDLSVHVINKEGRSIKFMSQLQKGHLNRLDERLWIEGNLSIAYGKVISTNDPYTFSLKFHPDEFKQALKIDQEDFEVEANNWYPGLFYDDPYERVCFPTSQHFLSDSPGHSSNVQTKEDMIEQLNAIDFDHVQVYSTAGFKRMMLIGTLLSMTISFSLLVLWLTK